MKNKVLVSFLIAMLCLFSISAAAIGNNSSNTKQGTAEDIGKINYAIAEDHLDEEAVEQTEDTNTNEDEAVEQTEDANTNEDEAVEQTEDTNTNEDEAVSEQTKDNDANQDETVEDGNGSTDQTVDESNPEDTDQDETVEQGNNPSDQKVDESKPEGTKVDKEQKGKSKVAKDQLKAKIAERAAKRVEAKDYIKGLRELFKDADKETKKEILSQIAEAKKELKDYSIGVFVKGMVVDFEKYDNVTPVIKDNRTLVPVRAVVETLGANVLWEAETNKITITKGDTTIVMQLDNKTATVNGTEVQLDVPPTIQNDRTMVPIRFISEALKLNVDWDDNSQTVVIDDDQSANAQ